MEVQVDGVPSCSPPEFVPSFPAVEPPVRYSPSDLGNPGKAPRVLPVRISVELTLNNGLHILQKDLDYLGLYRLIPKLEGIC